MKEMANVKVNPLRRLAFPPHLQPVNSKWREEGKYGKEKKKKGEGTEGEGLKVKTEQFSDPQLRAVSRIHVSK